MGLGFGMNENGYAVFNLLVKLSVEVPAGPAQSVGRPCAVQFIDP